MEIKAGDKVRIKSWEKLLEENADCYDEANNEIDRGPTFVDDMQAFCGLELTVIEDEELAVPSGDAFYVAEDEDGYVFCDWMVEEVVSEI